MNLIPQWKNAHRFASVQLALLQAVLTGAFYALPAFQEFFTPLWFAALSIGLSLAVVVARLIYQPSIHPDQED